MVLVDVLAVSGLAALYVKWLTRDSAWGKFRESNDIVFEKPFLSTGIVLKATAVISRSSQILMK